jgi:hypothetical protein
LYLWFSSFMAFIGRGGIKTMNTEILLAYLAVGSMAKLLTMKYPTPGQQWGAAIWITIGALVAGFLGNVILSPDPQNPTVVLLAMIGVAVMAHLGNLAGDWTGHGFDRLRIWKEGRKDDNTDTAERPTGAGVERDHRMGNGADKEGLLYGTWGHRSTGIPQDHENGSDSRGEDSTSVERS